MPAATAAVTPGDGVLDHGGEVRLDAHRGGGVEVEIRVWLAADDVIPGEDRGVTQHGVHAAGRSVTAIFARAPCDATASGMPAACTARTASAAPGICGTPWR